MKRRLIEYDVFEKLENESLSSAQVELTEVEQILSRALGLPNAQLRCFGSENVIYESIDGTFLHAQYIIKGGNIVFENIEQLVIDEETEKKKTRQLIGDMIDALLVHESDKAGDALSEYFGLPSTRRGVFTEGKFWRRREIRKRNPTTGKLEGTGKYEKAQETKHGRHASASLSAKRAKKRKLSQSRVSQAVKGQKAKRRGIISLPGEKKMQEWAVVCEHVSDYLDYKEFGPVIRDSVSHRDDRGNVVTISIPSRKLRNESRLLNIQWKTLNTDVVVKREHAKGISENNDFCKAVFDLKRQNAVSDNTALVESLENIVTQWPELLYLTQAEVSQTIKSSLEAVSATNYDDQTCDFMAEGILRTAHDAYVDRVDKILRLAGAPFEEGTDEKYTYFKKVVDGFYPHLDETNKVEMQVFVDLYETLRQVHVAAGKEGNSLLQAEVASHLNGLLPIINQQAEPNLEVASSASEWLWELVETNLGTQDWKVSNTPHVTVSGDHPAMAQKASQGYAPSSDFSGDYADVAPVSDGAWKLGGGGALADEMRNRAWGNESGPGTYPALNNPYILQPFGDYKISGEKHIDTDTGQLANWSSGDTWPAIQNPYVPKGETPQTYQMNRGKEEDLVVNQ